jgi:hypothetical protein
MTEPIPDLDPEEENNYVEAHIIIQEFYDDPTIFVVGSAPFGKIWFDRKRIQKQYDMLSEDWEEEYGGKVVTHSKKPRIVRVLLEEKDVIFPDDVEIEINGQKVEKAQPSAVINSEEPVNEVIHLVQSEPEPKLEPVQSVTSETITKKTKEPKVPKEPKTPKAAKVPKAPKEPKVPKKQKDATA